MSESPSRSLRFLPSTLFGRLLASLLIAVGATFVLIVALIVQDRRELTMSLGGIGDSSRRMADITRTLEALHGDARAAEFRRLAADPTLPVDMGHYVRRTIYQDELKFIRKAFASELRDLLGDGYEVAVHRTNRDRDGVIRLIKTRGRSIVGVMDVSISLPDGDKIPFRALAPQPVPPIPWQFFAGLCALTIVLVVVIFIVTRNVTRPLANLAQAADAAGRSIRNPPLPEEGVSEIRVATRAFNTMQDRLLRYLDSRTRTLAAMSHDLRTPLTRLRLRVESVTDPQLRARFRSDLDEMEGLVRGALALFKGVDDDESFERVDVNVLLDTLVAGYSEVGSNVSLEGTALDFIRAKPLALKRCLTNVTDNAIKFGKRAMIRVDDDSEALVISVSDEGPGIPEESLERVFEPFYRLESSRSRETGGTGLGLSIARDVAQQHGGSLTLRNRPEGGLLAELRLPRG